VACKKGETYLKMYQDNKLEERIRNLAHEALYHCVVLPQVHNSKVETLTEFTDSKRRCLQLQEAVALFNLRLERNAKHVALSVFIFTECSYTENKQKGPAVGLVHLHAVRNSTGTRHDQVENLLYLSCYCELLWAGGLRNHSSTRCDLTVLRQLL
jgi:hypothetical protein